MKLIRLIPTILFVVIITSMSFFYVYADESNKISCDYNSLRTSYYLSGPFNIFFKRYEEFLQSCPEHPQAEQALYEIVYASYQNNQYDKVMFYGQQYVEKYPKSEDADIIYFLMEEISLLTFKFDRAIKYYNQSTHYSLWRWNQSNRYPPNTIWDITNKIKFIKKNTDCNLEPLKIFVSAQKGPIKEQIEAYKKITKDYAHCHIAGFALFVMGGAYEKLPVPYAAILTYKEYLKKYPHGEYANQVQLKIASIYSELGEDKNALEEYISFVHRFSVNAKNTDVWDALTKTKELYIKLQQFDKAISIAKEMARRYPGPESDVKTANLYYNYLADIPTALKYYKSIAKQYSKGNSARMEIENKIKLIEENSQDHYKPLQLYLQKKYREILIKFPDSKIADDALCADAQVALSEGDYKRARDDYEQLALESSDSLLKIKCFAALASQFGGHGDYKKAVDLLYMQLREIKVDMNKVKEMIKKSTDTANMNLPHEYVQQKQLLLYIARICAGSMKDYSLAIKTYNEMLGDGISWRFFDRIEEASIDPCYILYNVALSYKNLGQYDKAIEILRSVEARYPDSEWKPSITWQLISLYVELEKWNEVLSYLKQVPDSDTQKSKTLNILNTYDDCERKPLKYYFPVSVYLGQGGYSAPAKESLEKIVAEYPNCKLANDAAKDLENIYLNYTWPVSLQEIQQYEQYVRRYKENKDIAKAMYKLASAYERIGYWDKALGFFKKIKEDFPESNEAVDVDDKIHAIEKKRTYVKVYVIDNGEKQANIENFKIDPVESKFIWIGTSSGLFKFNKETEALTQYKDTLQMPRYNAILFDPFDDNFIWFVGSGKALKYDRKKDSFNEITQLEDYKITDMAFDLNDKNILWVLTRNYDICKYNLSENKCDKLPKIVNKDDWVFEDMLSDPFDKNKLWAVLLRSIRYYDKEKQKWNIDEFTRQAYTSGVKIDLFNPAWAWAKGGDVIFRYDRENNKWEIFDIYGRSGQGNLYSFDVDKTHVWALSADGVSGIEKQTKKVSVHIGADEGFEKISGIMAVDGEWMWIASKNTLYRIDIKHFIDSGDMH